MRIAASFPTDALPALAATFSVQLVVSAAMFGVAVLAPLLGEALGVNPALIGAYMALAYSFGMVAGLTAGELSRQLGGIRLCQCTMLLVLLGTLALGYPTLMMAVGSAGLLGLAYGPINPVTTEILNRVSTPQWRPFIFSLKQTGMPVGAGLAGLLLPGLAADAGWQVAISAIGLTACVVAFAIMPLGGQFRREDRAALDAARNVIGPKVGGNRIVEPLRLVWRVPALRKLAISGFIYAGSQVAIASYYVVYVTVGLSQPLATAGFVFSALQLGAVGGRLLWGALADNVVRGDRVLAALGLSVGALALATASITPDLPIWALVVMVVVMGAASHGWNGVFFAEVAKAAAPGSVADAAGGIQFASLAGVAATPPLFAAAVFAGGYQMAFVGVAVVMAAAGAYLWRRSAKRPD